MPICSDNALPSGDLWENIVAQALADFMELDGHIVFRVQRWIVVQLVNHVCQHGSVAGALDQQAYDSTLDGWQGVAPDLMALQ